MFAAPADKTLGAGSAVPEPVVFPFRREVQAEEASTHLDLVGTVDQWGKIFAPRPRAYRRVEAYLRSRPGETRWSFVESPNTLEVREGETAYVWALHWRDTWIEIDNNESEARKIYQKKFREFKGRSLEFVARLVQGTKHSR